MIYNLNENRPDISLVGGKAKALMEMTKAGFQVPNAIVLSVDFFKSWLLIIKNSNEYKKAINHPTKEKCELVKISAQNMKFDENQRRLFKEYFKGLDGNIFAVRSSSPEEDLEGSSFAGMYETYLGITKNNIEKTVAKAFSSCFDFRVIQYKKQNNMDINHAKIAIIVQKQINSDVSGVGFSLNPLNNAYDEVLINGSFGLGEAIVSGVVTPDTYIYDYAKKKIIDKKIYKKEISICLKDDGGVYEVENKDKNKQALSNNQIIELSHLIKKCEIYYKKPMDIEWAYKDDKLYLLQSRPITTYLPIFKELMTKPNEKKRFYLDLMVMHQGIEEPLSVLGLDIWSSLMDNIGVGFISSNVNGTMPSINGRKYISITDLQKVLHKEKVKNLLGRFDLNNKKIFEGMDLKNNYPDKLPSIDRKYKLTLLKTITDILPRAFYAYLFNHEKVVKDYKENAHMIFSKVDKLNPEDDFQSNIYEILNELKKVRRGISLVIAGALARKSIIKMLKKDNVEEDIEALSMDLEANPTSKMGHLLFKMASYDEFNMIASKNQFIKKSKDRSFSKEFLNDYDEFMTKYACRGIKEIDVASTRIYEDVGILYEKLKEINIENNQIKLVKDKKLKAYKKLLNISKIKNNDKKFIKMVKKYEDCFGYREYPKYIIVYMISVLHKIALKLGQDFVKAGRLKDSKHIFDLHIEEISKAQRNQNFNLMAAREKNLLSYKKVEHIKRWPLAFDSRGKIYKPKIELQDGDIVGNPIAPGKIVGRAKVLNSPYEKPLNTGEILITRATEPSWTPVFINAAGVVMEIGGPLQHGGIIAREYGIPCVSGLIGIMDMIKDGDIIEVDGNNGIVKILKK